jgi:hypothetical protein
MNILALFLLGSIAAEPWVTSVSWAANSGLSLSTAARRSTGQRFTCLPKDVTADDVVSYGPKSTPQVTVQKKLSQIRARCRRGRLVDARGREIRFFRSSCWGNPPADYLEIQERENKHLSELKKRYTVIVFACNPMIQ